MTNQVDFVEIPDTERSLAKAFGVPQPMGIKQREASKAPEAPIVPSRGYLQESL